MAKEHLVLRVVGVLVTIGIFFYILSQLELGVLLVLLFVISVLFLLVWTFCL